MALPAPFDATLKRLSAALDHLDAAAERRAMADSLRADREEELAIMQKDRSRLAVELDGALARLQTLEQANGEAARRLARAEASIRAALGESAPDEGE
jgi:Domain of unknown function (DUF4164)